MFGDFCYAWLERITFWVQVAHLKPHFTVTCISRHASANRLATRKNAQRQGVLRKRSLKRRGETYARFFPELSRSQCRTGSKSSKHLDFFCLVWSRHAADMPQLKDSIIFFYFCLFSIWSECKFLFLRSSSALWEQLMFSSSSSLSLSLCVSPSLPSLFFEVSVSLDLAPSWPYTPVATCWTSPASPLCRM